jgi:glycosyltransferase involved in cell wall biosynthesis
VRRLLYVSYIFPPMVAGGAPRAHQFCKYLPEFGWAPTVLAGPAAASEAVDDAALAELPDCVRVVRADCLLAERAPRGAVNPPGGLGGWLRRAARTAARLALVPDRQVLWKANAIRAGREALARERHDAIFATFGPGTNLLVGEELARRSSLPLVVDFRDLWSDLPYPVFPTPLHQRLSERMERRVVAAARRITAVSGQMAERLARRHGRRPEEAAAVPNGFDPADLAKVRDERGPAAGRPFRLTYAGSVYERYDLGPFLDVLGELVREGRATPETLRVEFVGNFPPEEAARRGLSAIVECRPYVPHAGVFGVLARADALLMIEAPGYWAEFSYAAKVFDYLLPGKPVLALVEPGGNSARLLEAAGLGRIAHPADRGAIRKALLECLALKGAAPKAMDITRPPLADFDRRRLAARLAGVLEEAAGKTVDVSSGAPIETNGDHGAL